MSYFLDMENEPYRFDFFDAMRRFERTLGRIHPEVDAFATDPDAAAESHRLAKAPRPRIGDSAARRDEVVSIGNAEYLISFGQEPHLEFPASNIARIDVDRDATRKRIRVYSKFLGLLGPQGSLPLSISEEAFEYARANDHAFARFLDLFNQRFLQLFFRSWADSRPIVHNDRPEFDRFRSYVRSTIGVGSPPFADLRAIPEGIALYAGLLAPKAKSASRLRGAIKGLFGNETEIDQFIGSWLEFEEDERSLLGARNSGLGTDLLVGKASFSVQDKFRIRIFVDDLEAYRRFLPEGEAGGQGYQAPLTHTHAPGGNFPSRWESSNTITT